jgi:hypothetical protein
MGFRYDLACRLRPNRFFKIGHSLGRQLYCYPRKTLTIQGWQYNCHPNVGPLRVKRSQSPLPKRGGRTAATINVAALLAICLPVIYKCLHKYYPTAGGRLEYVFPRNGAILTCRGCPGRVAGYGLVGVDDPIVARRGNVTRQEFIVT